MEKKVDPGWNDPPMLNYSASNPPPKSRITYKRVAFPSATNPTSKSQQMSSTNTPPLVPLPLPSQQQTNVTKELLSQEEFRNTSEDEYKSYCDSCLTTVDS